ncbi:hypothetical protein PHLGIDRAFT_120920 [Phlebiopsis gigantea 11061_1 CR5-6]|uniref:Cytochrome c oxidase subunit 8, mitochondrial n=1 Tax=Phlebiopsis gigantea (strain 11061_1 CR5-6) TaxID=745531 RepID=A0A0C3S6K5_PHLG1|nr:hypothetical protein PHLGIDRAFT_120920 [Phlebiopsis gigantea 11061_1 CR5-6]
MSLLAASRAAPLRLTPRGVAHFNHAAPPHLPFSFGNRNAFRAKYLAFVGLGFALPFVAAGWQL